MIETDANDPKDEIKIGICESVTELFPSWPLLFCPQACTLPVESIATEWTYPQATVFIETFVSDPKDEIRIGMCESLAELFPNWPYKFHPIACTLPVESSAIVWPSPAATEMIELVANDPNEETAIGIIVVVAVLLPSCPLMLFPQACTLPIESTAIMCNWPLATMTMGADVAREPNGEIYVGEINPVVVVPFPIPPNAVLAPQA
jgi:hypothetical protein